MNNIEKLRIIIDNIRSRDKKQVDEINSSGCANVLEARLALADGRAVDALYGVIVLAEMLLEKEKADHAATSISTEISK
jgi:hypothetical protein